MYDWLDFLRICLNCGAYEPPIDILCKNCWDNYKNLSKHQFSRSSLNYDYPVKRIWTWGDSNNYLIKKIIYGLKGGHSRKVFEKLSLILLQKIEFEYYQNREIIFIPAPGLRPSKNHALYFTRALSEVTGCKFLDLLVLDKKMKKQKRLNKKERQNKRYSLSTKIKFINSYQIIFVDDVITTGSTARAAYKALGSPKHFEVWVLAERLNSNQPQVLKRNIGALRLNRRVI